VADDEVWAQRALEHIRFLVEEVGPRGATTPQEAQAAAYVQERLARLGLPSVHRQPFRGVWSGWRPLAVACSLALWGLLIALALPLWGGLIGALLTLSSAWIFYGETSLRFHPLRRWLGRRPSQNVFAAIPAATTQEKGSRPLRRVVLVGHLDTARTPIFQRTRWREEAFAILMPLTFVSVLSNGSLFLIGAVTHLPWPYWLAMGMGLLQAITLILTLHADHTPYSPGANDNASAVGTLLALAERLVNEPFVYTEVWTLFTGCGETGGSGMRAFLEERWGKALQDTLFIVLEGVGRGERLIYLTGEGVLGYIHYPPEALTMAERAGLLRPDVAAEPHRSEGYCTEMGVVARWGGKGLVLSLFPNQVDRIAHRHRSDDRLEGIEPEALARVHAFLWAMLQAIDAEAAHQDHQAPSPPRR